MFSGKATRLSGSCPGVSGWLEGAREAVGGRTAGASVPRHVPSAGRASMRVGRREYVASRSRDA